MAGSAVAPPVVVVGAGPVGLALAIDLAQRGCPVLLLDADAALATTGSRAICFAKRTLEIFDRLGAGEGIAAKGVSWRIGKVFCGDALVYRFDLLPEAGHERPAFVNIAQYDVEAFLVERAARLPLLEIRWQHRVVAIEPNADDGASVRLGVETPTGAVQLQARYVVACDGSRSTVRRLMGLESTGRVFRDRFLIADVKLDAPLFANGQSERWFWFDPPFHRGGSALLHRQPDDVWRMDFQLGWDADPELEKRPERIRPRVEALLAAVASQSASDAPAAEKGAAPAPPAPAFDLVWASVYTFACQRMQRFRQGRVLFAGDAAHGVSPFGARGANSGVQDADNLGWKLAAVALGRVTGDAAEALLDSYASEREAAADENIAHSSRSTDFITPKSEASRLYRDAVLGLAREHAFARRLVNSGRLSTPTVLDGSPLSTPDTEGDDWSAEGALRPGAVACDAPLQDGGWLLRRLHRPTTAFHLLVCGSAPAWTAEFDKEALRVIALGPHETTLAERYDLRPGSAYLLRPDQHVCARWRSPTRARVQAALQRALGTVRDEAFA